MSIFVDTSVWINYFSGKKTDQCARLDALLDDNDVCINGVIVAEILPILIKQKNQDLVDKIRSIKRIDHEIDWDEVVSYQVKNIRSGINGVGLPDLLILADILKSKSKIFVDDKHFESMKNVFFF